MAGQVREKYSPDGKAVLKVEGEGAATLKSVRLYRVGTNKPLGPTIDLGGHLVTALAVAGDDKTVATAIGNYSHDWGDVRVWDATSGKQLAKYQVTDRNPPLGEVFSLSFSRDGKVVKVTSGEFGGK